MGSNIRVKVMSCLDGLSITLKNNRNQNHKVDVMLFHINNRSQNHKVNAMFFHINCQNQ